MRLVECTTAVGGRAPRRVQLCGSAFATCTLQRAVFGTDLVIASQFHPLAIDSEIPVAEGSSLPGIPRHSRKFGLAARLAPRLDAGFTVRAQSGPYLRGDEANFLVPSRVSPSPTRQARFYSPGAPRGAWVGAEVRF